MPTFLDWLFGLFRGKRQNQNQGSEPDERDAGQQQDEEQPRPPGQQPAARRDFSIVIDPGHGGKFAGATAPHPVQPGTEVHEKNIAFDISLRLRDILRDRGYGVNLTREDDIEFDVDLNADLRRRSEIANNSGANLFLSIHCNSTEEQFVSGIETFHFPGSTEGERIAQNIQSQMMAAFPDHNDRGVKNAAFVVLKHTNMPAALVETEFMSNPASLEFLLDTANQDRIAVAVADGVDNFSAT